MAQLKSQCSATHKVGVMKNRKRFQTYQKLQCSVSFTQRKGFCKNMK